MIKTLSPYYVETSFVSPRSALTCTSYTLKIYVWNGAYTNPPITPSYTITKDNPTSSTSTDKINIARILNDYIDFHARKSTTNALLDGDNQKWCKIETYYATTDALDATVAQSVTTNLIVKGYGYGIDGENSDTPSNMIMLSGSEFKVNRNGVYSLPIEQSVTLKVIDAIDDSISIYYQNTDLYVLTNDNLGYQPTTIIEVSDSFATDYGTIAISGKVIQFTPGATFTADPQTFTYTIQDAAGNSDTATVTLTAAQLPATITAVDDTYTVNDTETLVMNVLTNDSLGTEPTTITSVVQTGLTGGTITITDSNTTLTFTPNGTLPSGPETFTYTITDSVPSNDTATVTLNYEGFGRYLEYILILPSSAEPNPTATVTGTYADTLEDFSFNVSSDKFYVNRCVIESSLSSTNPSKTFYSYDDTITC